MKQKYGIDVATIFSEVSTIHEHDTRLTSVVTGFGTLENYHRACSSYEKIPKIKTPTLILMAKDDPIIGKRNIDYRLCEENPWVMLAVTNRGGHCGYHESLMSTDQWFVKPMMEFLNAYNTHI